MSNGKNTTDNRSKFIEMWAQLAMEHQIRYGIPASITLAQAAIESSDGTSYLYQKNACFGVKLGNKKGQEGTDYVVRADNTAHDKFRIYESREASFEDHSRLLVKGDPYKRLSTLSATDHKGWAQGLQDCNYATDKKYAEKIENVIKYYNLTQYDKQATEMASQRGVTCGYAKAEAGKSVTMVNIPSQSKQLGYIEGSWHMPLAGDMRQTGEFGEKRTDHIHQGIDIGIPTGTSVYATEDNGVVTGKGNGDARGNYVEITYPRQNGKDLTIIYMHLNSIDVKEGDSVKAGQIIGKSGSTGRSTGPHLHFEVREGGSKGTAIDPKEYLAEIAVRGNLDTTLKKGNEDVLLAHKREFQLTHNENENLLADNKKKGTDWMSMLANGAGGGDLFGTFLSLIITAGFDLMAKEEIFRAEKQKNNKETEISDKDMAQYKSDGVSAEAAKMKASTTYDSINNEESQSQTQRKGIV